MRADVRDRATHVLDIEDLTVDFSVDGSRFRALDGANLRVGAAETVGLVGESGAGKSTLALAACGLLPASATLSGSVRLGGIPVVKASPSELRSLRRRYVGFVFQSAVGALDPTRTVRALLRDVGAVDARAAELLQRVALPSTNKILGSYPHELSGGMAQRVAIAIAIAHEPHLIIADEPTASLDSSIRQQILALLFGLRSRLGASVLFLSHDIGSVGRYCDRVAVMYGGRVVEEGGSVSVLGAPNHPYTAALLAAAPGTERPGETLEPITGTPPLLRGPSDQCAFAQRCRFANQVCTSVRPEPRRVVSHDVICHRAEEITLPRGTPMR